MTFVSVHQDKSIKSGLCEKGMVEFINTSSLYTASKNTVMSIQGHIFSQNDVEVRVGALTVNYPKLLLIQFLYRPAVFTGYKRDEETYGW